MSLNDLIKVTQLPVIEERLRSMKESVDQRVKTALALICNEDTIQAVKAERSALNKEFSQLEDQRKAVKAAVMGPYEAFEAVYRECVSDAFRQADTALKAKILGTEDEIKRRCEEGLRDYFAELCAVHHLDWLTYDRAGIKVDMASAKAKTPKKLREQLVAFVAGVSESVDRISLLDDADEIMVEYQRTLDAADAICTVQERHQRIEEQKQFQEARNAIRAQEAERVRRVEALAPPVAVESPGLEKTILVSLVMHPTKVQYEEKIKPIMKQLRDICDMEGIKYE